MRGMRGPFPGSLPGMMLQRPGILQGCTGHGKQLSRETEAAQALGKNSPALQRGGGDGGRNRFHLSAAFIPRESRKGGLGYARCRVRCRAGS